MHIICAKHLFFATSRLSYFLSPKTAAPCNMFNNNRNKLQNQNKQQHYTP